MEIIDLGKLPARELYSDEIAFIHENRPTGIYSASIYAGKFFCSNYVFYRSKSLTDFTIYSDWESENEIFGSPQLLEKTKKKRKENVMKMFSVSKEEFIGFIRQEKHPALDWLLFNQDLWNK